MANRRMFSNKIVMSAKFLKMPSSSQALYFHLALNADDDGVVEAFSIMRIVGSAADDLKILIAKGFIIQLNEDEVCFIVDWLEHNQIRADRKVDSIYHDLLVQTVGNIKLIEAKPRADRSPKDGDGTSQGQRMGGVGKDSIGKDSIGKDSIGKDSIGKDKKQNNASDDADSVSEIFEYWKQVMESPRSKIDDKRTKAIKARLKDYSVEYIKLAIDGCSLTDWNMGRSEKSNGKKYNDIELICRDNTHLDDFAKVAESSKKSNVVFKINKDSTVEFWSYIDQEWQHPIGYTPERALADMDQYGWNLQSDDREVK